MCSVLMSVQFLANSVSSDSIAVTCCFFLLGAFLFGLVAAAAAVAVVTAFIVSQSADNTVSVNVTVVLFMCQGACGERCVLVSVLVRVLLLCVLPAVCEPLSDSG